MNSMTDGALANLEARASPGMVIGRRFRHETTSIS